MNLEKIFKNLIILESLYLVFYVAIATYMEWDVPLTEEIEPFRLVDAIFFIGLIFYYVVLYFLYKFKPIGKTLYVPLLILYLILGSLILQEQYAFSALDMLGEWISGILSGLIIALLYFTDIKDKFTKT